MPKESWSLLIELGKRRGEIIKNYERHLSRICTAVRDVLGDADVYLFGSVVEGRAVALSDIDIIIVAEVGSNMKKAEVVMEIEEKAGLPFDNPFEFHLLTSDEFRRWRKIFKPKIVKIC